MNSDIVDYGHAVFFGFFVWTAAIFGLIKLRKSYKEEDEQIQN